MNAEARQTIDLRLAKAHNVVPQGAEAPSHVTIVTEPDAIVEGLRPLVAPGTYLAAFDTWYTALMFGGHAPKLILQFALTDLPLGTRLERFYNVRRLIGKPRRHGRFVVGAQSDFTKEFLRLVGRKTRLDRIACSALEGHVYRITARTVTTGADQKALPQPLQYSVISSVEPE